MKNIASIPNYDAKLGCRIADVITYAKGKPDTPGWRNLFAENRMLQEGKDFISMDGHIYPVWALLEAEELKEKHPEYFE